MPRPQCPGCKRPLDHCLCALIPSLPSRTRVLILQHPSEASHALNTARLAAAGLGNAQLLVGEVFTDLPRMLAEQYVVNFSLFQSLPDHWAINALFPIVPLQRLNERPRRNATLVDISCDSDGKIDRFIDLRDVRTALPVHDLTPDEPYYLGIFLTGAYQDVLANAHNLFGRVNEAHVRLTDTGPEVELYVEGQKARRVIQNMGYLTPELHAAVAQQAAEVQESGGMTEAEVAEFLETYDRELVGYTYLEAL